MDALTETLATLDHLTAAHAVENRTVERFLLRTGRPLPRVIVVGPAMHAVCRQVDMLGGDATGLGGPRQLARAEVDYPGGRFVEADLRDPGLDQSFYDGAWLGALVGFISRAQLVEALQGLHASLRPGGLLYLQPEKAEAGWQKTPHGRLFHEAWTIESLATALGTLDFSLVESADGLIFRREY